MSTWHSLGSFERKDSAEELPRSDRPVGMSTAVLIINSYRRGQATAGRTIPWAEVLGSKNPR